MLAVTSSYPLGPGDGNAPFVREIAQGMARQGAEVHVVLPEHPRLEWSGNDAQVTLHAFRSSLAPASSNAVWGYGQSLSSDRRLRPAALLAAPFVLVSGFLKMLEVVRRTKPDLIHAHWLLPNGLLASVVSRRTGVPFSVSVHGSDVHMISSNPVVSRIGRWVAKRAESITVCSSDLKRRLQAADVPASYLTVVPYGVDVEHFSPANDASARPTDVPDDSFLIGAVGRLVEKKGFIHLVEAMAKLPDDSYLVIVGDGAEMGTLRDRAEDLGIADRVIFLGQQKRDEVRDLLRAIDVLAVPSVIDKSGNVDGLPNVLLEGLASGCAVVASRIAGIPDVVIDGTNGILVDSGSVNDLADALADLRAKPDMRVRLGNEARRRGVEDLSWDDVICRSPYMHDLRDVHASRLHTR